MKWVSLPGMSCNEGLGAAVQVSAELIRMAILWHEMWHEALEEASRLYFGESDVQGMLNVLQPLHQQMANTGPSTLKEIAFIQVTRRFHVAPPSYPPAPLVQPRAG